MQNFDEHQEVHTKLDIRVWKKILKVMLQKKVPLIMLIVSSLLLAFFDVLYPLLNSYAIKTFFGETPNYSTKIPFIIVYVTSAVLFGVVVFGFIKAAGTLEVEIGYELRKQAFNKVQVLSYNYFDKTPAGWVIARLTNDSRRLSGIVSWGTMEGVWSMATMLGALVVMFIIKWQLALIMVGLIGLIFLISMFFRRKILKAHREIRRTNSKITASYNEGIMGNKTSKTLVLERHNYEGFHDLTDDMKRKSIRAVFYSSIFWPILIVVSYTGLMFILNIGGDMVIKNIIDVATLYLFVSYSLRFFDPVIALANILAELQQAQAAAERIISLIEEEPQIIDTPEIKEIYGDILHPKTENYLDIKGNVTFKNVTFSYVKDETILDNFNLDVKEGDSIALVGATGSGKSTIVNLVCRFYEPNEGEILIDGKNYKDISLGNLRSNLGYVLQTPHLFNMSVVDNIRYGKRDATLDDVIAVSKAVGAHEFISKMEHGYDTFVGEEGSLLSAGERQLISFARALLVDPKILVLDEATSSIDTETEKAILGAIEKVMKGRTTFIVAHRLSTIRNVSKILVIDKGKIIESGTHQELIDLQGEYYTLYKNQFIDEQVSKSVR
ncbi:MAG TPA: ABC transporter ATP-binding protein [Acholeplasmataceae bacterium]|nr:ABC transporter ATP-binding protein [Acholeplasmataceae bacterium]HQC30479.1 ABC transporter ATP-binding protein [Acholeplasmataceae bacterium]